jgi:hypothetical protein
VTRADLVLDLTDPVPPTAPRWPRLEGWLARLAPTWAARRAARRHAEDQHALARYVAELQADERHRRAAALPTWWSRRSPW